MNIDISCDAYWRMSGIPLSLEPEKEQEHGSYLRSIYFERRNGNLLMIASNAYIAAIENLGPNAGPDESFAVIADAVMAQQCQTQSQFDARLNIVANPMLGFTSMATTLGYQHPGNAAVPLPENSQFDQWRRWLPDAMPERPKGIMSWAGDEVHRMADASPSGGLRFPCTIDTSQPLVVMDKYSNEWIGIMMVKSDSKLVTPHIPAWVR